MALNEIKDICGSGEENQPILQLFDNKCFTLVDGKDAKSMFCLDDFAFPVDGHSCISIDLSINGGEHILFDNNISIMGSPIEPLTEGSAYIRGILLKIEYPKLDSNGEEIDLTDKNVDLYIQNASSSEYVAYPLHNLFALFTNPKSNSPTELINKLKIVNMSSEFSVNMTGLLIYGKAQ